MRVARDTECDERKGLDEEEPPGSARTDELRPEAQRHSGSGPVNGRHDLPVYPGRRVDSQADEASSPIPHLLVQFPGRNAAVDQSAKLEPAAPSVGVRRAAIRPPLEGALTRAFRKRFFRGVSDREWNDWRWQTRSRYRTLAQLEQVLRLSDPEREALVQKGTMLPVAVTPYYMSLLDPEDPDQPLRKTVIPSSAEFVRTPGEADDPLGEDGHSPVPGLVHRYPDRVLLLAHDFCSTYCRYCTRSRVVGHHEIMPNEARLEQAFDYLRKTPAVRDVLLSGGDPLALGDDRLDWILSKLRAIPHIEFVRIGTKMPAVLPQRITPQLCRILKRHHPLWMSVHFLHASECTPEATKACARLADSGIPLGCQTVLLKGVNDSVDAMKDLTHRLLTMRVRPYYLYQCDPISGSSHFRTSIEKGLEIIAGLRGHTTGYACPTYVVDAPGGGGKIPLLPNYLLGRDGDDLLLRNFEGKTYRYRDPVDDAASSSAPLPEPDFSLPLLRS
ncbi:MAG TPA: KamA family radical SAM protein [Pirellulaceae bacterium]|jgi:lysine 2,3-aminomutase|nr:KamA family radical SAM protein [Pirellulaceae bacterium]